MPAPIRALAGTPEIRFSPGTLELVKRAAATGRIVETMDHNQPELLRFIHYKLHQSARIRQRARWPGGAIWNWALGEGEADYIHCAGAHLVQILDLIGVAPPDGLQRQGKYALAVDWAQLAYDKLRRDLGLPPHVF